ncbi:MAG TPA: FAD-binding protein, partial [Sphaerochaeta sp.]|nr:FAD-binding protein [Sphaerochaeta sp.]
MASNVRITGQIIKFSRTPLAPTSSIRTGGIATHYVRPESFTALREVLLYAAEHALSYRAIGALTNTLVSDHGVDEIVIDTRSLDQVRIQGALLIAQSGAAMDQVIET